MDKKNPSKGMGVKKLRTSVSSAQSKGVNEVQFIFKKRLPFSSFFIFFHHKGGCDGEGGGGRRADELKGAGVGGPKTRASNNVAVLKMRRTKTHAGGFRGGRDAVRPGSTY